MNYDMTFCTGDGKQHAGYSYIRGTPCPLRDTCERYMRYEDRPKNRALSWFVDPPFEGDTCEHYVEVDREE